MNICLKFLRVYILVDCLIIGLLRLYTGCIFKFEMKLRIGL